MRARMADPSRLKAAKAVEGEAIARATRSKAARTGTIAKSKAA